MSDRVLTATLTMAALVFLVPLPVAGQERAPATSTWTAPRTVDGQPDLQGVWTMATFTPMERPAHLAGKEFFTEQEAAALSQELTAKGVDPLARTALTLATDDQRRERLRQSKENIHYDNAIWLSETRPKGLTSRRTSLVVDPPDGKIPPLTPDGKQREAERMKHNAFLLESYPEQP